MRRIVITLMSISLVAAYSAFAQDDSSQVSTDSQAGISANDQGAMTADQPGTTDTTGVTTAEAPAPEKKRGLVDEKIGFKPQIGNLNFRDASSGRSNRALYGFMTEFNVADTLSNMTGMNAKQGLYLGPALGFFYSHIGAVGGSFFGDNGSAGGVPGVTNSNPGANMFLLPANLKVGSTFGSFRISAHGGGNVIYRSAANAVLAGKNTPNTPNSKWGILPNAGADLEYGILNGGAIVLRPDVTFGGSNSLYQGTLGISLPIG